MRTITTILLIFLFHSLVHAEEYHGNFQWEGKGKTFPFKIIVNGDTAIQKSKTINIYYEVVENTKDELLLMKRFTKENSGKNYPVGMALIVLDKKSGVFVRSNTFAGGNQNNHAIGVGKQLK